MSKTDTTDHEPVSLTDNRHFLMKLRVAAGCAFVANLIDAGLLAMIGEAVRRECVKQEHESDENGYCIYCGWDLKGYVVRAKMQERESGDDD